MTHAQQMVSYRTVITTLMSMLAAEHQQCCASLLLAGVNIITVRRGNGTLS